MRSPAQSSIFLHASIVQHTFVKRYGSENKNAGTLQSMGPGSKTIGGRACPTTTRHLGFDYLGKYTAKSMEVHFAATRMTRNVQRVAGQTGLNHNPLEEVPLSA